jgi:hypothetical protein
MRRAVPGPGPGQQPERTRPPRPVLTAIRLMSAGAALEVLALLVALVTIVRLKLAIVTTHPGLHPGPVAHR